MSDDAIETEFDDVFGDIEAALHEGEVELVAAPIDLARAMYDQRLDTRRRSSLFKSFKSFFSYDDDKNTLNVDMVDSIFRLIDTIQAEPDGAPRPDKVYLRKVNHQVFYRTTLTAEQLLIEQDFLDAGIKSETFMGIVAIPADGNFLSEITSYTYPISLILSRKGYLPRECLRSSRLIMDENYGRIVKGLAYNPAGIVPMRTHRGHYACWLLPNPPQGIINEQGYYLYRTNDAFQRIRVLIVHPDGTNEGLCLTTQAANIPELNQLLQSITFPSAQPRSLTIAEIPKKLPWWIAKFSTQNLIEVELIDIFHSEALSDRFTHDFSYKIQESDAIRQNGWWAGTVSFFGRSLAQFRYGFNPPVKYTHDTIIADPGPLPETIAEIARTFVHENIADIDGDIRTACSEGFRP